MKITPKNNEVFFDKDTILVSKTDTKGVITYGNQGFFQIVGLPEKDVIGQPHNLIRHPDMPKVIFKLLWEYLKDGREIHAYVKNLVADGSYYWVFANVTPSLDTKNKVIGYHSARRCPSKEALEIIKPLYKELIRIEKQQSVQACEAYLTKILNEKGMKYDEFILSI